MTRKVCIYAALAFLMLFCGQVWAEDARWLIGNWVLTYDPDGSSKDKITFTDDGKFSTTDLSSGRHIDGVYVAQPGVIKVNLIQMGQIFMKLDLTYDENKNKLYYKGSTGKVSYYMKIANY